MSEEKQIQQPQASQPQQTAFELSKSVTVESLEALPKIGKVKAVEVYDRIAEIGGFGSFGDTFRPALDVAGLPAETKNRIAAVIAEAIK